MVHVAQNTISNIRTDLFNKMQELPIKYFDRNTHGDLMSLYTNDIDNISEALNNSLTNIFASDNKYITFIYLLNRHNLFYTIFNNSCIFSFNDFCCKQCWC